MTDLGKIHNAIIVAAGAPAGQEAVYAEAFFKLCGGVGLEAVTAAYKYLDGNADMAVINRQRLEEVIIHGLAAERSHELSEYRKLKGDHRLLEVSVILGRHRSYAEKVTAISSVFQGIGGKEFENLPAIERCLVESGFTAGDNECKDIVAGWKDFIRLVGIPT